MHRFALLPLVVAACGAPSSVAPESAPHESDGTRTAADEALPHGHDETHDHAVDHSMGDTDAHHHRHHGGMQHDFSDVERWVGIFDNPERDVWQMPEHLVELLEITPGMTVADIGAGTGYLLPYLAEATGAQGAVLALDVEETLVAHMTERVAESGWNHVEARVIDPANPGLDPGSVDRVVILDTWHHIGDRETYESLLRDSLSAGGAVYVVDFTLETHRGPGVDHRLAPELVAAELAAGGLEASLVQEESLPDQYVVVGRRAD